MNEVMILRRGGGGNQFAVIGAEYPEGATCTCTGKKGTVLTAKQSPWIFNIPVEDEWTVKISKTENGKLVETEQTVTVEKRGQCFKLILDFDLVMVFEGTAQVQFTAQAATAKSIGGAYVVSSEAPEGYGFMYFRANLDNYSKLYIDGKTEGSTIEKARVFIGDSLMVDITSPYHTALGYERTPYEVNVSTLSGEKYIAIAPHRTMYDVDNALYRNADAVIYTMRLE